MRTILSAIAFSAFASMPASAITVAEAEMKNPIPESIPQLMINETYTQEEISNFLSSVSVSPMARSEVVSFSILTGMPTSSGEIYLLRNAKTEEWYLFRTTTLGDLKFIGGGEHSTDSSARQNSIGVNYNVGHKICENFDDDFSTNNDLLFLGFNSYSEKGSIVMIFGDRARNSRMVEESSHEGTLVSRDVDSKCRRINVLSALFFMKENPRFNANRPIKPKITSN